MTRTLLTAAVALITLTPLSAGAMCPEPERSHSLQDPIPGIALRAHCRFEAGTLQEPNRILVSDLNYNTRGCAWIAELRLSDGAEMTRQYRIEIQKKKSLLHFVSDPDLRLVLPESLLDDSQNSEVPASLELESSVFGGTCTVETLIDQATHGS